MDPELEKLLRQYASQKGYDQHPLAALAGIGGPPAPAPVAPPPDAGVDPRDAAADLYDRAHDAERVGQYDQAYSGVTKAAQLVPSVEANEAAARLEDKAKASKANSDTNTANYNQIKAAEAYDEGVAAMQAGDYIKARDAFAHADSIIPNPKAASASRAMNDKAAQASEGSRLGLNFGIPASALDTGAGPSWAQSGPIPDVGPIKVSHDDPALVAALQAAGELPPAQPKYGTHDAPSKTGVTPGLADTMTPANAPGGPDITPEQLAAAKAAYAAKQAAQNAPPAEDGGDAGATVFGGGSGGGYIPGGFARTSPAEYDADLLAQTEAQKTHAADAEIDKQLALQAYRGHLAERGGELEAERDLAALEQKRQWSAMRDAKAASQAADAAAQAAVIDPKHLFKEMGTGGQVLAILGVALGSVGAGLQQMGGNRGATNQAMAMLNRALDDDMHAQEANMSNKRATAAGALAKLRDQTGDLEAAKMAYKRAGLTYAQNQLDQLGAGAQADELRAGLQAQMDKLDAGLLQYKMQTTAYVAPKAIGGNQAGFGVENNPEKQGLRFDIDEPGGGHTSWAATTQKAADELADLSSSVTNTRNLVAQMRGLTKDGVPIAGQDRAVLDSIASQLLLQGNKPLGLGVLTEKEMDIIKSMKGDPTSHWIDGVAIAEKLNNNANAAFRSKMRSGVAYPVKPGFDPKTGKPAFQYTGGNAYGGSSGTTTTKKDPL